MNKPIDDRTELGRIIRLARGDRSLRQYAEDAGVNFTTVNKIEKGEYKPSPKMIRKLTSPEAKTQNGITYEDVMSAAGFRTSQDEDAVAEAAHEMAERIVDERLKEEGITEEATKDKSEEHERENNSTDEWMDTIESSVQRRMILESRARGVILNALSQRGMVFTNIHDDDRPWRQDKLLLAVDKGRIKEWRFMFRIVASERSSRFGTHILFGDLLRLFVDDSMKFSIVTNDRRIFSFLASREHSVPFRGELSAILVDLDELVVQKEVYLSNYYEKDHSSEFFIV